MLTYCETFAFRQPAENWFILILITGGQLLLASFIVSAFQPQKWEISSGEGVVERNGAIVARISELRHILVRRTNDSDTGYEFTAFWIPHDGRPVKFAVASGAAEGAVVARLAQQMAHVAGLPVVPDFDE
jgi:hypothetical protein